jgi:hypothetical protein
VEDIYPQLEKNRPPKAQKPRGRQAVETILRRLRPE